MSKGLALDTAPSSDTFVYQVDSHVVCAPLRYIKVTWAIPCVYRIKTQKLALR